MQLPSLALLQQEKTTPTLQHMLMLLGSITPAPLSERLANKLALWTTPARPSTTISSLRPRSLYRRGSALRSGRGLKAINLRRNSVSLKHIW